MLNNEKNVHLTSSNSTDFIFIHILRERNIVTVICCHIVRPEAVARCCRGTIVLRDHKIDRNLMS